MPSTPLHRDIPDVFGWDCQVAGLGLCSMKLTLQVGHGDVQVMHCHVGRAMAEQFHHSDLGPAFTLPVKSVSNEKRIPPLIARREPLAQDIGRL